MSKVCWTHEQEHAIKLRAQTILVSAAAGSGKTAVLTERAVRRMLCDNPPLSADRLLVVTFTRAAADEMKSRIKKRLNDEASKGSELARRQRILLEHAVIGTIHAMCFEIIRENLAQHDTIPAMRIGEDIENAEIRSAAVEQALEEAYADDKDIAFLDLVDLFISKRDDEALASTVLSVLDYARVHPHYRGWLDERLQHYQNENPVDSPWGVVLLGHANRLVRYGLAQCKLALETIQENPSFEPYETAFLDDENLLEKLSQHLREKKWDACREALAGFSHFRLSAVKTEENEIKSVLQALRKSIKSTVKELEERVFSEDEKGFREDIADLQPKIKRLFRLACRCDDIWAEKKRAAGLYTFSDLEQMALEILTKRENGDIVPTRAALDYASRFDEVMVDEYQDINRAQDMILRVLTQPNQTFLVGDVKQSIYRFRHASPELFEERARRYAHGADKDGHLITLTGNFRSRAGIIDAVNETFSTLMTPDVGGIDYKADHQSKAMAAYDGEPAGGVSFLLVDTMSGEEEETNADCEAAVVAKTVANLLNSGITVGQGDEKRPLQPNDIAILLRSLKNKAERFRMALKREGIGCRVSSGEEFLQSREIVIMYSLLRVLDNPTRDIDLAAVLLSPLFGLTDDELSLVRLAAPQKGLYAALACLAPTDEKAASAFSCLERLRHKAASTDAVNLIYEIYAETGFETAVLTQSDGERRRENLLLLARYADEWHRRGRRGLGAFVAVLEKMRDKQSSVASSHYDGSSDAVCIATIHGAKGLEWPVVVLADTTKRHGYLSFDNKKPYLLHPELGFACVRRDLMRKVQYTTLPLAAVRIAEEEASRSEEMRILYVAMTRAKERLIMTAAFKNPQKELEKFCGTVADPDGVSRGNSFAHWILQSAMSNGADENSGSRAGIELKIVSRQPENVPEEAPVQIPAQADFALYKELEKRLCFVYPCKKATEIPAKLSVSMLSHDFSPAEAFKTRPAFASAVKDDKDKVTFGRGAGSALHKFMQLCDYSKAASDISGEINRLCDRGSLTNPDAALLDTDRLANFFAGSLAKRILASQRVLREFRFMADASVSAESCHLTGENGESTLLQGIADCVFFENDKPIVVDYKTDRVDDAPVFIARYGKQLRLYRDMLSHVLKVPVASCVIYAFWPQMEINI